MPKIWQSQLTFFTGSATQSLLISIRVSPPIDSRYWLQSCPAAALQKPNTQGKQIMKTQLTRKTKRFLSIVALLSSVSGLAQAHDDHATACNGNYVLKSHTDSSIVTKGVVHVKTGGSPTFVLITADETFDLDPGTDSSLVESLTSLDGKCALVRGTYKETSGTNNSIAIRTIK